MEGSLPGPQVRNTIVTMSVATGRIRGGQVVLEGEGGPLPEGRRVLVVIEGEEEGLHLDDDSIRELREAQQEVRQGNFVTGEALLGELDQK